MGSSEWSRLRTSVNLFQGTVTGDIFWLRCCLVKGTISHKMLKGHAVRRPVWVARNGIG